MKFFLAFALLSLFAASSALAAPKCGLVFDGAVRGVDVDQQSSTARVFASWTGFEDGTERERVLRYEWAVISDNLYTEAMRDGECRLVQGFTGHPDVLSWTNVETKTHGSAPAGLSRGATYYTIIRATTSFGVQKYVNSDGFTVSDVEEEQQRKENVEDVKQTQRGPGAFAQPAIIFNQDCPIDQQLIKNSAAVSVGEFLESIYGPAEFSRDAQANIIFTAAVAPLVGQDRGGVADQDEIDDDDDNDDDDDLFLGTGSVIGIAIGITAFCCILVLGIIILTSSAGKSDKFGVNVRRNENQEDF